MVHGVMGKVLWVDLSAGTCLIETIPDIVYERLLSGMGLAAYLLYQRIPPGADPLGPQNVLGFVSGLLGGAGSLVTGRWMAAAKSPLTGAWGETNCGGTLSPALKHAGFDGIFFTGASQRPVYLFVENGRAELRDASGLWGLDTRETEQAIRRMHPGRPVSVACIGLAGERLSRIAGIVNDEGRLAARSGLGAVMGSKRLKALVVRGSQPVKIHDRQEMKRLSKKANVFASFRPPFVSGRVFSVVGELFRILPLAMRQDGLLYKILLSRWGTIGMNQVSVGMGDSPIRNWTGSNEDFTLRISSDLNPDRITDRQERRYHCRSCPIGCGGVLTESGNHKPEYETVMALGGLLVNHDLDSIYRINERLNRAGMDSISAGGTIAFAIECYQHGLLTHEDTGGMELTWGDAPAIERLVEMMIRREGIGNLLADGSRAAAERIGRGSERFAVQARGQELAMHDSRNDPGFALHAVVDPAPGRHTTGSYMYYEMFQLWKKIPSLPAIKPRFYPKGWKYSASEEQAKMAAACSQFMAAANGAGLCLFGAFIGVHRLPFFEWLNAATGWRKKPEEYLAIGRNIHAIRQAFNAREGLPPRHDINPRALGLPPLRRGANRNRSVSLDRLVPLYWKAMGCDPDTGKPDGTILSELDLE